MRTSKTQLEITRQMIKVIQFQPSIPIALKWKRKHNLGVFDVVHEAVEKFEYHYAHCTIWVTYRRSCENNTLMMNGATA